MERNEMRRGRRRFRTDGLRKRGGSDWKQAKKRTTDYNVFVIWFLYIRSFDIKTELPRLCVKIGLFPPYDYTEVTEVS